MSRSIQPSAFSLQHSVGVTAIEAAIVVALIGGFLGAATVYQRQLIRRARELALRAELQSLRASVSFFEATRHRLPATLDEIVGEPIGRARFGPAFAPRRDAQGRVVDVFGSPYRYDRGQGSVATQTAGYDTW